MKHTIAENRQLFNVKKIVFDKNIADLAEGEFGIFAIDSETSIPAGTTYATLPQKFTIVSKLNGKVYYSFDTIDKSTIKSYNEKEYIGEQVNIWKGIIESCDCIENILIKVEIEEEALTRRDGMNWTTGDSLFGGAPKELTCQCDCTGKKVYDNNIMTLEAFKKINSQESEYYEAEVQKEDGTVLADEAAIQAFIDANKAVNTDDDETNDGELLVLVIKGKLSNPSIYKDLDINHIHPRGVRILPSILINGETAVDFEEIQDLRYEVGAGSDMRAEEFANMSLYTTLNFEAQLDGGFPVDELVYQFENSKHYNTVSFEFYTDKVNKNDGDKRSFFVLLASDDATEYAKLKAIIKPV